MFVLQKLSMSQFHSTKNNLFCWTSNLHRYQGVCERANECELAELVYCVEWEHVKGVLSSTLYWGEKTFRRERYPVCGSFIWAKDNFGHSQISLSVISVERVTESLLRQLSNVLSRVSVWWYQHKCDNTLVLVRIFEPETRFWDVFGCSLKLWR